LTVMFSFFHFLMIAPTVDLFSPSCGAQCGGVQFCL